MNKHIIISIFTLAFLFSCEDSTGTQDRKRAALLAAMGDDVTSEVVVTANSSSDSVSNISEDSLQSSIGGVSNFSLKERSITPSDETGTKDEKDYSATITIENEVIKCRKEGRVTINGSYDLKVTAAKDSYNKQHRISNLKRTLKFDNCRNGGAITIVSGEIKIEQTNNTCNLKIVSVTSDTEKQTELDKFKTDLSAKKDKCNLLAVGVSSKWTVGGYSDKAEFTTVEVNADDELTTELNKSTKDKDKIIKLSAAKIGYTPTVDYTYWTSCRGESGFEPGNGVTCPTELGRNRVAQILTNFKGTMKTTEELKLKKSRGKKAKTTSLEIDQTVEIENRVRKYNVNSNENAITTLTYDGLSIRKGKIYGIIKINGSLFNVNDSVTSTPED